MHVELEGIAARHPAAAKDAPPALQELNLTVAEGEHVAVIGPSGAGKTTLMHVLACALRPSSGRMRLDAQDPWSMSVRELQHLRGRLFIAPQTPPLPARQRVVTAVLAARLPAISLWQSIRSLLSPQHVEAVYAALARFDLGPKLWDRVDRLSGGERQRVGLARALLAPASMWLVDEPLSALDPTRARLAIDTLVGAASERRVTLIATLHQVDVAVSRFARIVGLRDGQLAFDLPAAQVTRERLTRLYAQFEHELEGAPPAARAAVDPDTAHSATPLICR